MLQYERSSSVAFVLRLRPRAFLRGSHETWQGVLIEVFLTGLPNTQAEKAYLRLSVLRSAQARDCGIALHTQTPCYICSTIGRVHKRAAKFTLHALLEVLAGCRRCKVIVEANKIIGSLPGWRSRAHGLTRRGGDESEREGEGAEGKNEKREKRP
jgi:hypothetical protein